VDLDSQVASNAEPVRRVKESAGVSPVDRFASPRLPRALVLSNPVLATRRGGIG
jgi:hypothetical protein